MDQPYDSSNEITPASYSYIGQMAGWIKFSAIAAIIGLSLLLVFIFIMSFAGGSGAGVFAALFLAVILGLCIWLFNVLLQSGNAYSTFSRSRNLHDLETGVRKQKVYWIVVGILTILGLLFGLIGLLGILGSGIGGGFGRGMF